ncbi:peptidase E [Metabacillus idriensis]|uniref:Type 1 glutamine amidotransferase-like domain-containing protein n=1 Tax=Metabacillus idriensis TaxID=324768 RepID=UPI00163A20BE|nr:peptidase E [Metabacillus idriensis]QNG58504.1 peptidase E [Bacillus sp. PAMC26568]
MRQIIAMGGGGFSMEPENPLLDEYILKQSMKDLPKICFVATASGDQTQYIERFYDGFHSLPCVPDHLALFDPHFKDLEDFVLSQDILYVGGGSTRNLLVLWKEWGLDLLFKKAYENGIILAGLSAGAICWFEEGLTDPMNAPLYKLNGLGILNGSCCPHYDGEEKRRPAFHDHILSGKIKNGYALDDGAALHFIDEQVHKVVSSRQSAKAFYVKKSEDSIFEEEINPIYLGDGKR